MLGHSVNGSFVQNNTMRHDVAANQIHRFRIQPRPNVQEQYSGHTEAVDKPVFARDINHKFSFYQEQKRSQSARNQTPKTKKPTTPGAAKQNWNQFQSPDRARTPVHPQITPVKTNDVITLRAAERVERKVQPGVILAKPYRKSVKRHSYQYRFHNPELPVDVEAPNLPVDVEV